MCVPFGPLEGSARIRQRHELHGEKLCFARAGGLGSWVMSTPVGHQLCGAPSCLILRDPPQSTVMRTATRGAMTTAGSDGLRPIERRTGNCIERGQKPERRAGAPLSQRIRELRGNLMRSRYASIFPNKWAHIHAELQVLAQPSQSGARRELRTRRAPR